MNHGYVTIRSAAEILGVSTYTLRQWDKQGRLTAKRSANNHYRLYNISDLERFAKETGLRRLKKRNLLTED